MERTEGDPRQLQHGLRGEHHEQELVDRALHEPAVIPEAPIYEGGFRQGLVVGLRQDHRPEVDLGDPVAELGRRPHERGQLLRERAPGGRQPVDDVAQDRALGLALGVGREAAGETG